MRRSSLIYSLLALLLLWFVFRQVTPAEILLLLRQLRIHHLCLLALLNGLVLVVLALRWYLLLWAEGYRIPLWLLLRYRLAAFGVTYFTPGPQFGGEPLQVYLLRKHHAVPLHSAIATVMVDKVLEMIANFGFLAAGTIVLLQQGLISEELGIQGVAVGSALMAIPLFLFVAYWQGHQPLSASSNVLSGLFHNLRWRVVIRWFERITNPLRKSEQQITQLCRTHPQKIILACGVTGGGWIFMVGEFAYAIRALGISLPFADILMLLIATRLAFLLPMPAGIGTLETSLTVAFQLLGLDPAAGLALSLLIRIRDVGLGLWGLWLGKLHL